MNKRVKIILQYGLLFINGILLFLATIAVILNFSVFKSDYILRHLKSTNYYKELFQDIKMEMSYYTNQSGFEDDILDDIFTLEEVTNDVKNFVIKYYNNEKYTVDTTKVENRLSDKIDKHIETNNFKITNHEDIDNFVKDMGSVYAKKIKLMDYADHVINKFNNLINKVHKLMIVLLVIFFITLIAYKVLFKRKHIAIILYMNTFLALSLLLYVKSKIRIDSIFIYGELFSNVLISIIHNLFLIIMVVTSLYFILGICLSFMRKKVTNEE